MYLVCAFLLCVVAISLQHQTKDEVKCKCVESIKCKYSDEVKCKCVESIKCKYWVSAVSRGNYLDLPVCGYDRHTFAPLLCCPSTDDWVPKDHRTKREVQSLQGLNNIQLSCTVVSHSLASPVQIANQKCEEYGKLIFQSLYEVSVGGSPFQSQKFDTCAINEEEDTESAEPREFPHMALIGYGEKRVNWVCAGSLISERFILSSAICLPGSLEAPPSVAKLGDLDISTDEDLAKPQQYKISDSIAYPDYKQNILYHDIALFKLDRDVTFTIYVRPACLFTRRDPPDNKADATGWGKSTFAGKPSDTLKKIKMDLVTTQDCNKVYNKSNDTMLPQGILADRMICAKEAAKTGAQVCQGDGGGPLQIPLKKPYCMYGIIGLTSFGKTCGQDAPGVFTRVSYYLEWIVENVWSE